mgnify:CR=1 FL=1
MRAKEMANETVVTISPDRSLADAAEMMRENHVGDLVVVEEGDDVTKPVGIITDRDLVMAIAKFGADKFAGKTVGSKMSDVLLLARNDDPIEDVVRNMRDNGIRRIPVVDADGQLSGILTLDDLIGFYGEQITALGEIVQTEMSREITGKTGS